MSPAIPETDILQELGWDVFSSHVCVPSIPADLFPARVAVQHKNRHLLFSQFGELRGELSGKLLYESSSEADLPAVGDWVIAHPRPNDHAVTILELLPRKSKFSRQAAGNRTKEQIVAANVDVIFVVTSMDQEFSVRRLERYLLLAVESGAQPVVVLNKADLCSAFGGYVDQVRKSAPAVPIHVISALGKEGVDEIRRHVPRGITGALLGSSGVGKSTIINTLLGEERLRTGPVRSADDKGRHVTTHRELLLLPGGGLLIDTPGMRELQLWGGETGIGETFPDILAMAEECRFKDCAHEQEPGCAVQRAIENGSLDTARYKSYQKLLREIAYHARRQDSSLDRAEKRRIKKTTSAHKRGYRKDLPG